MSSKTKLKAQQLAWANSVGKVADASGYLSSYEENLYQKLSSQVQHAFETAGGSELRDMKNRPAKLKALHSSAALAVNFFAYWESGATDLPLRALGLQVAPAIIEFEAQFPTGLAGIPPNLDVAFRFIGGLVIGVESKFSEWLTPKAANKEPFKPKYFPESVELWSEKGLPACQRLASEMRAGKIHFRYLDASQLLKHALGLACATDTFELLYLFFDWQGPESVAHREEVALFERLVGSDFKFHWRSYHDVFKQLRQTADGAHGSYLRYLGERYFSAEA